MLHFDGQESEEVQYYIRKSKLKPKTEIMGLLVFGTKLAEYKNINNELVVNMADLNTNKKKFLNQTITETA